MIDGETGFVVNPFNVEALADRFIRLLTDEDLRRRWVPQGWQRVHQHFTLQHQTEIMLTIYERARTKRALHYETFCDRLIS